MNTTSLTERIRSVRLGVRSRQPLQHRIDLVRERSEKRQSGNGLRMQGRFDQPGSES